MEERLVRVRVLGVEVVDVPGGDERKARLLGQSYQLGVDLLAPRAPHSVAPRTSSRARRSARGDRGGTRVVQALLGERARNPPWRDTLESDEPLGVGLEQLPVDSRLVVVALEIPERAQLDEVGVPLVRLGEQRQVRVALGLRAPVVGHVHLAADDRLHACIARLPVELDRASERAVVGERDGGHLEALRLLDEQDPARAVEDRVLGVDVQMDEWRRGGATRDG